MKKALLGLLLTAVAFGCTPQRAGSGAANKASSGGASPTSVVARVGQETITEGDLAAAARKPLARLETEHAEKVYEVRRNTLNQLIEERLMGALAKKEGITTEQLLTREVTSKVPNPSEEELKAFYERTKASGRPLPPYEQIKDQIVGFMKQGKTEEAKKALLEKARADRKVEDLLAPMVPPKVEVAAEGPSKGDPKAPVTIVEFSDFECPYCSRAEEVIKKVLAEYQGKVRVVYRDYPLPFHGNAQKASEAALCAGDQGKYWEMHERLFANQQALAVPALKEHAKALGVDAGKFDRCLDSGEKTKVVEASKKAGDEVGVSGTPAFFINGRMLSGAQPFEKFKEVIDHELKNAGS